MEIKPIDPVLPLLGEFPPMTKVNERKTTKTYIDSDGEKRVRDVHFTSVMYDMNGREQTFTTSRVIDIKA